LSDNWVPVIEKDVDGPNSLPLQLDSQVPNLGKYHATRRVARTVYLGSAPTMAAAHHGLEDRHVKLGCVMPGESPQVFGDALRRLAATATFLYQDGPRYWYSTQPTVTKLADDRAEQLKRDSDKVAKEIADRVRTDVKKTGDLSRVHPFPPSGHDVPDDLDARLVVIGTEHPYSRDADNAAEAFAKRVLESRGNSPRLNKNTLVFLAVDKTRLQDLDEAVRRYLAWESILHDKDTLNLTPSQVKQAETQKGTAESTVTARLPEAYQWLLVPTQQTPQSAAEWQSFRLTGQDALAVRASRKLKNDELLVTGLGSARLRMDLDKVPLWRGDHVAIRQLVEDFGKYLYLPRVRDSEVLLGAIRGGFSLLTWEKDSFAYAESYDEGEGRYRGLRGGQQVSFIDADATGLLVKSEIARKQLDAETKPDVTPPIDGPEPGPRGPESVPVPPTLPEAAKPKRFHGSVELDPTRVGRDAGRIADEVISHLAGLVGSNVTVTLEIEAEIPNGAPDNVVRTVTENGRTLKFKNQGFEKE
jgi:hypothetical protein